MYNKTKGAFFWGYSYSGLGITEYTEFQFVKERSCMFQSGNGIRSDLRTSIYFISQVTSLELIKGIEINDEET